MIKYVLYFLFISNIKAFQIFEINKSPTYINPLRNINYYKNNINIYNTSYNKLI